MDRGEAQVGRPELRHDGVGLGQEHTELELPRVDLVRRRLGRVAGVGAADLADPALEEGGQRGHELSPFFVLEDEELRHTAQEPERRIGRPVGKIADEGESLQHVTTVEIGHGVAGPLLENRGRLTDRLDQERRASRLADVVDGDVVLDDMGAVGTHCHESCRAVTITCG